MPSIFETFAFYNIQKQVPFVLEKKGFMEIIKRFVREANRNIYLYDLDVVACANSMRVMPDAFFLDEENRILYVYEIEDQGPLLWPKLMRYYELSEEMFDVDWRFHLFVTDRYGLSIREIPIETVELVMWYKPKKSESSN